MPQGWIWQVIQTWPKAYIPRGGINKNYQVVKIQIAVYNKIAQLNLQVLILLESVTAWILVNITISIYGCTKMRMQNFRNNCI